MYPISYFLAKVSYKLKHNNKEVISNYFRKAGMTIGNGCNICCNIMNSEPYLISLGDNVTISGNVTLITHDNSIQKVIKDKTDVVGPIRIGNNCFIGAGSMVLLGVTLADNIIVAAGSVVTKSFHESEIIIAGNPAKKIGTWSDFKAKYANNAIFLNGLSPQERKTMVLSNLIDK